MGTHSSRYLITTMKTAIILSCLLAGALSQEQEIVQEVVQDVVPEVIQEPIQLAVPVPVAILHQEYSPNNEGGAFNHAFEAEDGTSVSAAGSVGSAGQVNIEGSYTFTLEDGTLAVVTYLANEAGFKAESALLPVAPAKIHPDPPHVAELLRIAAEQREQGIQFDSQGFRI